MTPTPTSRRTSQIQTERLDIRILEERDAAEFLSFIRRNRDHIAAYMPDEILNLPDAAASKELIAALRDGFEQGQVYCFGAWTRDDRRYVAHVYVQMVNATARIAEIGYFSDVDHEGRGFVSEAVTAVTHALLENDAIHKVMLVHDGHNTRSAAVARRCGFVQEGILRQHELAKDGTRPDRWHWGKMRGD